MEQISVYLPGLLLSYITFFLASASPGPSVLAIMGTAKEKGRPAGLAFAFGVFSGSCFWAILAVAGLSTLIATYAPALLAIKICGGLYLIWLGIKALRSAAQTQELQFQNRAQAKPDFLRLYRGGLLLHMTNPKAAMAWLAIASIGVQAGAPTWVGAAIVIGCGTLSLLINGAYALIFSTPILAAAYAKVRRGIQFCLGGLFCFSGGSLLLEK